MHLFVTATALQFDAGTPSALCKNYALLDVCSLVTFWRLSASSWVTCKVQEISCHLQEVIMSKVYWLYSTSNERVFSKNRVIRTTTKRIETSVWSPTQCTCCKVPSKHPPLCKHPHNDFPKLTTASAHAHSKRPPASTSNSLSAHLRARCFNSKKRPESTVSSSPALQSIAVLIDYLPVTANTNNEEGNNNDDNPFQDIDEINNFTVNPLRRFVTPCGLPPPNYS